MLYITSTHINTRSPLHMYHGTSNTLLTRIQKDGLYNAYLANSIPLAQYYAEETVERTGGTPIVLSVTITDTSQLRYDRAAMDEPVVVGEEQRDSEWERAYQEHPEWCKGEIVFIPNTAWEYSWRGVGSVICKGFISPASIKII